MEDAMALSLNYILAIINTIPNSPMMWLYGLFIVLAIIDIILEFTIGRGK